jgi:aspartate racemase
MEGRIDGEGRRLAREAVEALRARRVQGVVLGCTEVPLLLGEHAEAPDLLNPAQLLAEAAVRAALE